MFPMTLPGVLLSWIRGLEERVTAGSLANARAALRENDERRAASSLGPQPDPALWDLSA